MKTVNGNAKKRAKAVEPHFHKTESGKLVACYHYVSKLKVVWTFLLGITITYPLEHLLWEGFLLKLWPFTLLHSLLGH